MKSPGPWTMKTVSLSSIVLLAFFLGIHLGAAAQESDKPCCLYYSHHVIPWNWVHSYELAKGSCPQDLMVFTTKRGKFCVQPKAKWVQTYISLLEAQKHL
ncbi:C-C motif chemokine 26 [Peromyscus californicus insignis]|uniref:C-C motif chemokine 26 n=1 Tax=Peromyscus californicus insignis TaxID=564181 RepID=UPI0022A6FB2B|nr:C-C motif chemokine 26 [Peromyscus californicus insignis]